MECYRLDVEKISAIKVNNGENLQNSPSIMEGGYVMVSSFKKTGGERGGGRSREKVITGMKIDKFARSVRTCLIIKIIVPFNTIERIYVSQ